MAKKTKKKTSTSVMAKWGPMKWVLKSNKILPIQNDLSIEYALDDNGKKEKIPVSFSYAPAAVTGTDVKKEIERWKKLVGKAYPLYIGKKRFGPSKLKLTSVNASDINVYAGGRITSAAIDLSFMENKKKSSKTSKKKSNGKSTTAKKTKTKKASSK